MLKRDPYNSRERWQTWKAENGDGIKGISKENSVLILSFLFDMELGKNLSTMARKGERSPCRLLDLKSRLIFFVQQFNDKPLYSVTKDEAHRLFFNMRDASIVRCDCSSINETVNRIRPSDERQGLFEHSYFAESV